MKSALIVLALLCIRPAAADDGRGYREWTSASGAALSARYERLEGDDLVLVREDGTQVMIGLDRLSEEDRARARQLAGMQSDPDAGPHKLPVFDSGPWSGYHAVYRHDNFDALVDADGVVTIHLKDGDRRLEPPLTFRQACYFVPGATHIGRKIKAFHDPEPPSMQPGSITLSGVLDEDIPFETVFRFRDNRVAGWGWNRDHREIRHPTTYRLMVNIPPSHDFAPQVPREERVARLEGYELILEEHQGGRREYTYHESVNFTSAAREAVISAPMWAPREVTVVGPRSNASMWPHVYPGGSLWQGYRFLLVKREQDSRQRAQRIEIRID